MPQLIEPKTFLLAETQLVSDVHPALTAAAEHANGTTAFLDYLGVPNWTTDAHSDSEKLIEMAGKLCYMSFSTDLNKNLTRVGGRNNQEYIQDGLIKMLHGSVLEHASVSFALMNVSRVFTHELVRHRVGTAFSQVSGRFVRTDVISYWLPKVIRDNQEATKIFNDAFAYMEMALKYLEQVFDINGMTSPKAFALKKILTSAFRRIIGNGQSNHIILSVNHRTLRHLIQTRTDPSAEEEIRLVFNQIFDLVRYRFPAIYGDAMTETVDGYPHVSFMYRKV